METVIIRRFNKWVNEIPEIQLHTWIVDNVPPISGGLMIYPAMSTAKVKQIAEQRGYTFEYIK